MDGPESRIQKRWRRVHESLLRALYQIIADDGVDAVVVSTVTDAADVSANTFYNHFESRDAAIHELLESMAQLNEHTFDDTPETEGSQSAVDAMASIVERLLVAVDEQPTWAAFMCHVYESKFWPHGSLAHRLEDLIRLGQTQGVFLPGTDVHLRALLIGANLRAALRLAVAGNDVDPALITTTCLHIAAVANPTDPGASDC
ncbi:MAG: TetR/AcrR family transcriptional regulator [Actinomycetota bacterium]|nr:TetR/AcrR family transcriptional regulator [Actinomycetota bacterium]